MAKSRRPQRGLVGGAVAMVAALLVAGCSLIGVTYRYKLTIEVADPGVPGGVRAFSSVWEVSWEKAWGPPLPESADFDSHMRGEAVVIAIPGRAPVFALITRPENSQWAVLVPYEAVRSARGAFPEKDWVNQERLIKATKGQTFEVPKRSVPDPLYSDSVALWPFFVRFGDITDPRTVEEVSPEELGVRRVTVTVTDEPLTTGIEKLLPWLLRYRGKNLDGTPGGLVAGAPLSGSLGPGSFSTELSR